MDRVLVTGGCGFVGANLVSYLNAHDVDVRVIDDLRAGREEYLPAGTELRIGDAADPDVMGPALRGADAVVHLASETGVAPSLADPRRDFLGSPATTFAVLEACRVAGIKNLVFASSGAALGDVDPPLHENLVPRPLSPYGAGKLAGEAYCSAYAGSFGMETVALRFSNVYGPYSLHKSHNAIPRFIKASLTGAPIELFGDGTQSRDFVHVDDICAGIHLALTTPDVGGEIFQLATGVETRIIDLARTIQDITGSDGEISVEPARSGEVYRSSADISKVARMLGYKPQIALRDGLTRTVEWYRENL